MGCRADPRLGRPRRAAKRPEWAEPSDPQAVPSPDDEALLEFHFNPTANLQIAIWLEGADETFLEDVFVTQSTAKLGIGNRSGMFLFLSSWRAPYGPRESVLPIWAHRRGKTYPKIIFHDANIGQPHLARVSRVEQLAGDLLLSTADPDRGRRDHRHHDLPLARDLSVGQGRVHARRDLRLSAAQRSDQLRRSGRWPRSDHVRRRSTSST